MRGKGIPGHQPHALLRGSGPEAWIGARLGPRAQATHQGPGREALESPQRQHPRAPDGQPQRRRPQLSPPWLTVH